MSVTECVSFLQRLIQTESLPGREGPIADLVIAEMKRLGYDDVRRDEAGNIIGLVRGSGHAPPMMFNTHLDHVDVGDPAAWPHPPFGAEQHADRIWGRGAVDIKGPLATQIHGVAQLIEEKRVPPGDVYVTAVVQEEVGGLGARYLPTHLHTPFVIVGEPSSNQLRRGHRGRTEIMLHVKGRSVHASIPHRGVNPLEAVARFIVELKALRMRENSDLGPSSVAPTLIRTDQTSANVIPAEAWLTLDWRNIPEESGEDVRRALEGVARTATIDGAELSIIIPKFEERSYTGYTTTFSAYHPSFLVDRSHPALRAADTILKTAIGLDGEPGIWRFATDGGHFAAAGMTVLGFGPGDETLAHTVQESIEIDALEVALRAHRALALEWPSAIQAS